MLGKLFKNEMRSTGRIFWPFILAVLGISVVDHFVLRGFGNFGKYFQIPQIIFLALYVILLIAINVLTLIVVIRQFYKGLLGQEGYLMFTLPVRVETHVFSKLISAFCWSVVTAIVSILSVLITIPSWRWVSRVNVSAAARTFQKVYGMSMGHFIGYIAVLYLVGLLCSVLMIYASISIGQLVNNHRGLLSFGAFMGLYVLEQAVFSSVAQPFVSHAMYGMYAGKETIPVGVMSSYFNVCLLLSVAFAVLFFFVTQILLKRHLNLQ